MVLDNIKKRINLVADYTGLASAVAGPFGLITAPLLVPSMIVLWGITKTVQSRLGYVNNGALNTDYADLCMSRDVCAAFSSLYFVGEIASGNPYNDWKDFATNAVFPILAATAHIFRRKNLRELEDRSSPLEVVSSNLL